MTASVTIMPPNDTAMQEILRQLTDISKDHEKRIRVLERVGFGALAIVTALKYISGVHVG